MIIFVQYLFSALGLFWRDWHFVLYFYVKMTTEYIKILTDFSVLIADWNSRMIKSEKEFMGKVADVTEQLQAASEKQEEPEVEEE